MPTAAVATTATPARGPMPNGGPKSGSQGYAPTASKSGGAPGTGAPQSGGEIALSNAEALALTAFETEDNEVSAYKRAEMESGLSREQLKALRSRADKARRSGYTLKGQRHVFKPTATTDEPGLLGKHDDPVERELARAKKAADSKAKEALAEVEDGDELAEVFAAIEDGDDSLMETWSDAARQASAAARKAKAKGGDWRQAGRKAYYGRKNANWQAEMGGKDAADSEGVRARIHRKGKDWRAQINPSGDEFGATSVAGYGRTPGDAKKAAVSNAAWMANRYRSRGSYGRTSAKSYIRMARAAK